MTEYKVKLNEEQRKELEQIIKSGTAPARKIAHAHILLKVGYALAASGDSSPPNRSVMTFARAVGASS